jgi:hypothetical protein
VLGFASTLNAIRHRGPALAPRSKVKQQSSASFALKPIAISSPKPIARLSSPTARATTFQVHPVWPQFASNLFNQFVTTSAQMPQMFNTAFSSFF